MADRQRVKNLKYKHNHLENHWSSAAIPGLDPSQSERTYKLHLGRMMDLYANHKMGVNNQKPPTLGKRPSPLNLLYGIKGIRSGFDAPGDKIKNKEKNFSNRVTMMENLERNRPVNLRPKSAATAEYNPSAWSGVKVAPIKKKRQYRRCLDPAMPEDDVVLRGLYKLDDRQSRIYEEFARMISHFDHFDSINILADVLTDSVHIAGMEDFTGAVVDDEGDV